MPPDSKISAHYEAAAQWLVRRQDAAGWDADVEAQWQAWLQADPAHRMAYEEMSQTWAAFDHVARPELASDAQRAARAARAMPASRASSAASQPSGYAPPRSGGRRGFALAAVLALAALGLGGWYRFYAAPLLHQHLQTAKDERRDVTLPDGTVLSVNRDSLLDIRFHRHQREVELRRGEVFFDVASLPDRPFYVVAGNTTVRVLGTSFNVRVGSPSLQISVQEGRVEVRRKDRSHPMVLGAGDAVSIDVASGEQWRMPGSPDMAGSWRTGQLVFRDALLADVVDELRTYLGHPIELTGKGARHRRLSGFASTSDPQAFLNALPQLLPVTVQRTAAGAYRISVR